jgi:hypothetical protein
MRLRFILPSLYFLFAIGAWIDFARLPRDGLANLGLMLVVFPVTLLDLYLRPSGASGSSVFIPNSYGYYYDHAVFFGISVSLIAGALFLLGRLIDRRRVK